MYTGLHVNVPVILVELKKLNYLYRFWEKYSNIKFHENLSSGSRVFPCGRTDRRDEDNFANARRNHSRTRNTMFVIADKTKVQYRIYGRFKLHNGEVYDRPKIA
jgi:hypothetical protein